MSSGPLLEPFARGGKTLVLLGIGLALAGAVCVETRLIPLVIVVCFLLPLLAFSRANMTNLAISYIIADHLSQFLKRAIFVLGPQQPLIYYGLQSLALVVLIIGASCALYFVAKYKWPTSVNLLLLWLFIGVGDTLLNPRSVNILARLGGSAGTAVPVAAVFIGMGVTVTSWRSFARVFSGLIVISSIYGCYQYFVKYTIFDKAWAFGTHAYSIQGGKVYNFLIGATDEIRAYSYYADFLTWGLFLVTALLFITAAITAKQAPKRWMFAVIVPAMAGIVLCGTRTVWVGLLGALIVYRIISMRGFRRPLLVMASIFLAFGMVQWLGAYLVTHGLFNGVVTNPLLKRYETIGTIEARVSAPEIFVEMLPTHLLLGEGFGATGAYKGLDENQVFRKEAYSHNVIVDLLLNTGFTGLLVMGMFLYFWFREAFWVVKSSTPTMARAYRWLIALVTGLVLTGGVNGYTFMGPYFYLMVGIVAGEWCRLQAARKTIGMNLRIPVAVPVRPLARQA